MRWRNHRARVGVALCLALAALTVAPALADASPTQSVGDLQAQAKQVASQINSLQARTETLDEQYLDAQNQAASLKTQLADKQAAVAKAKSAMSANQQAARNYAVNAYVGGGDVDPVLLPSSDTSDASNRTTYLASLQGSREQVIDNLRASSQQLNDEQQSLSAAKTALDTKLAGMQADRASMQSATDRLDSLQKSVNGQLAQAVAAEQARIAAAQQAAAQKAAQQAAARAAAEAARPVATVPHVSGAASHDSGGSSGSSKSPPAVMPVVGPVSPGAAKAISAAESQLGVPYHWAESDPGSGFDCSGLVMWAYAQAGVSLPHSSRGMWAMTQRITADQLQPGDLVFGGSPVHHVGLYVGNGEMINAPHTGADVSYASIYTVNPASFGRI